MFRPELGQRGKSVNSFFLSAQLDLSARPGERTTLSPIIIIVIEMILDSSNLSDTPSSSYLVLIVHIIALEILHCHHYRHRTWVILLALALERRPLVRLTRLPVRLLKCWISRDKFHDKCVKEYEIEYDLESKSDQP